ncbi:MAG: hypothetical protein J3K34DRAFT_432257 [Monoraphidium minutum]|nr:MAG: hypothetical protein J3K34DRAFT_432257 [Monoraphidium minutum]
MPGARCCFAAFRNAPCRLFAAPSFSSAESARRPPFAGRAPVFFCRSPFVLCPANQFAARPRVHVHTGAAAAAAECAGAQAQRLHACGIALLRLAAGATAGAQSIPAPKPQAPPITGLFVLQTGSPFPRPQSLLHASSRPHVHFAVGHPRAHCTLATRAIQGSAAPRPEARPSGGNSHRRRAPPPLQRSQCHEFCRM